MSKMVQALLSGMFFTFILDFFLFLGIFEHYINAHGIALYYNILFADHQNIFLFFALSIFFGYITIYKNSKLSMIILLPLFVLSFLTLIPPIGEFVGELLLIKKDTQLQTKRFLYRGDILYIGRQNITFFDYNLNKKLVFEKNKIIGGM